MCPEHVRRACARRDRGQRLRVQPTGFTVSRVDYRGGALCYELVDRRLPWARGGDEPIVFHHGLGACAEVWRGWEATFCERHRLLTFDMRGHGHSPVPDGYPWTLDALVDDLQAVVDAAGLARFHLVGESIGGTVALAFAARHPERVQTLTVSNGAHRGAGIRNLESWGEIIARGGMAAWSTYMMQMRFHEDALSEAMWQWYETQQAHCDAASVLAAAAALAAADLTPELSAVDRPVLLLHPDGSPFIPVAVMGELNAALAHSRLRVFAHARHGLPYSHASECADELARFIA